MKTRILMILGGIIVGFWIFSIIFTQITLISIPSHTIVSGGTTINNEGKIIESFQVVPEVTILQVTGFALLVLGAYYEFWEKIKTHKKLIVLISGIISGIFLISLTFMFVLEEQKLDSLRYDISYVEPDEKLDITSIPHTVEITGLKQTYVVGDEIAFTVLLKGNGTFCKGWDLQIYDITKKTMWGNKAEQNVCSTTPLEFERTFQYSSFPRKQVIVADKLVVNDMPDMHNYPSDYELIFVTGYGDVIKRILHVTDSMSNVTVAESLPPCDSDVAACFQDKYTCDPVGWGCGNTKDIFSKAISLPPLKQFKLGISVHEITCNEGVSLLLKPTEFTKPVCVTDDTYVKLSDRGWSNAEEPFTITASTPKWKIPEELEKIGCTDAMVIHLKRYSNAFDEKWNGEGVAIEDIGLPWGVHQYALDECMKNISELRNNEN